MASRRQKERTRARHAGVCGPAAPAPLVPHTRRCPCAACEQRRTEQLERDVHAQQGRRRDYDPGHEHPEHRSGWAVTVHALAEFMVLHDIDKFRNKVTHLDMRPAWLSHLDASVEPGAHDLDEQVAYDAFLMLRALHPLRGRIVQACCIEGRTHAAVAREEFLSDRAISQNLQAARGMLQDLYGALLLVEQHHAQAG